MRKGLWNRPHVGSWSILVLKCSLFGLKMRYLKTAVLCFQDGYLEGELLDGRKGLVPSNLIERLSGEDLLEFHQSCVIGAQEEDIWSTMVPSNLPMDYGPGPGDTSSPMEEPMSYQCKYTVTQINIKVSLSQHSWALFLTNGNCWTCKSWLK